MKNNLRCTKWLKILPIILTMLFFSTNTVHAEKTQTVTVSNVKELIQAITSNRIIKLQPAEYNLSSLPPGDKGTNATLEDVSEGYELTITDVQNLTIEGMGDQPLKLLNESRYANIISFNNCEGITIGGIEAGHLVKKGACEGGVFRFESCKQVTIDNCVLFGCGTEGLTLSNIENFTFNNSVIKDCSRRIMTLEYCQDLKFSNSEFSGNRFSQLINIDNSTGVAYTGCRITNNTTTSALEEDALEGSLFYVKYSTGVSITNTKVTGNKVDYFVVSENDLVIKNVTYDHNTFRRSQIYKPDLIQGEPKEKALSGYEDLLDELGQAKLLRKLDYRQNWEGSAASLEEGLQGRPEEFRTECLLGEYFVLGFELQEEGAWDKALRHLQRAIELEPDSVRAHFALARLYMAVTIDCEYVENQSNNTFKVIYYFSGKEPTMFSLAEEELLKVRELSGYQVVPEDDLILIYFFQGHFKKAAAEAKIALQINPKDKVSQWLKKEAEKRIWSKKIPKEIDTTLANGDLG